MAMQGSSSYYTNSRCGLGGSAPGRALQAPGPVYKNLSIHPSISVQPNAGITGNTVGESPAFHVESSPHSMNTTNNNCTKGMSMAVVGSDGSHGGVETVKKKRGRPRKYGPEGPPPKVYLKLSSPLPKTRFSSDPNTSGEKARRGRPPGTGWKQKLAPFGEWMNSSAGQAFTPHVLHIGVGEDIAEKILAFAQQRPRALCIMSGTGSVSVVTLKQPANPANTATFEGRFEILCLSGSYLVDNDGGPRHRNGGISISVCSPDGHMLGGAIGGRLIAATRVQVVGCSFVYDATKAKTIPESRTSRERYLLEHASRKMYTPFSDASRQSANLGPSNWQLSSRPGVKGSQDDIDLTRG